MLNPKALQWFKLGTREKRRRIVERKICTLYHLQLLRRAALGAALCAVRVERRAASHGGRFAKHADVDSSLPEKEFSLHIVPSPDCDSDLARLVTH
ncbi:hypothetical protein EVAR_50742_1 [Eumeta japonica]|uniref:Uncharacterized protein n=1 Tax=Eumeta variegata TaxID=151549 RepID=A0A4C1Y3N6_EUMVA|nr:hypothetical protein EVAR_50742_1 [Eumeta japonica]